jgi:hypothetical protein
VAGRDRLFEDIVLRVGEHDELQGSGGGRYAPEKVARQSVESRYGVVELRSRVAVLYVSPF